MPLLLSIQNYFQGVGVLYKDLKINRVSYRVTNPEDIIRVIIPHFNTYPLLTQKHLDFLLWSKVVDLMVKKKHLTLDGLKEIIKYKKNINKGLTSEIKKEFSLNNDVILNEKFVLNPITSIPDPNWLVGFVAGESSFNANINSKTDQIRARFFITQHSRDLNLLKIIKIYLGDLGGIYKVSKSAYNYEVSSYKTCFEFWKYNTFFH
jgi:hypothetical protein